MLLTSIEGLCKLLSMGGVEMSDIVGAPGDGEVGGFKSPDLDTVPINSLKS